MGGLTHHRTLCLVVCELALLCAAVTAGVAGCGYCGGALRLMRAQTAELYRWPGGTKLDLPEPVPIQPNERFRVRGDGPKAPPAELLQRSGITAAAWFLVRDSTGEHVPAKIGADSGGHMCRYGVGFNLEPLAPLAPGRYTLVLRLDQIAWPMVEDEERRTFEGKPAMVRRFIVETPEPANPTALPPK